MNPMPIPQGGNQGDNQKFKEWVLKEHNRLTDYVMPMGGPTQAWMLEFWRLHRPEMWERLEKMGIAKELAHVLDEKCEEAIKKNMQAGMYSTDAREQAEQDWLILEPEQEEGQEEENELLEESALEANCKLGERSTIGSGLLDAARRERDLKIQHNDYLDRAIDAINRKDEPAVLRWMARAEEIEEMLKTAGPVMEVGGIQAPLADAERAVQVDVYIDKEEGRGPADAGGTATNDKPLPNDQRITGIRNSVNKEEQAINAMPRIEVEAHQTFSNQRGSYSTKDLARYFSYRHKAKEATNKGDSTAAQNWLTKAGNMKGIFQAEQEPLAEEICSNIFLNDVTEGKLSDEDKYQEPGEPSPIKDDSLFSTGQKRTNSIKSVFHKATRILSLIKPNSKNVLWIGVALVGLLLIFPPWRFTLDIPYKAHIERPGPYSLICNPPKVPITSRSEDDNSDLKFFCGYDVNDWTVKIDWNRCNGLKT